MRNAMDRSREDTHSAASLNAWLATAREDLRRTPPPWGETQLQARIDERRALRAVADAQAPTQQRPARVQRRLAAWFGVPALATAMAVLFFGGALLRPATTPRDAPAAAFAALTSIDAIVAEPGKVVVQARVPRALLTDYGLPIDPARADVPVEAEFLLSARGMVLAVRFVE
jgi:hypothetical protein